MDLVDLNGMWTQRPDYLIEGNEAHRLLQAKFMSEISGGQVEYRITSSIASNPSGTGRADIVYFNSLTKTVEVYEIKPGSYTPGAINYAAGQSQLQGYIEALNRNGQIINGWQAEKGISLNSYFPSLTVEKQKNGCKASKINACSRFLFRNDMCYCAIFFTLW